MQAVSDCLPNNRCRVVGRVEVVVGGRSSCGEQCRNQQSGDEFHRAKPFQLKEREEWPETSMHHSCRSLHQLNVALSAECARECRRSVFVAA